MKTNPSIKKSTVLTLILLAFFLTANVVAQQTVKASDIIKDIKAGKTISYKNITVIGTLDMTFMDEKLPELPKRKRWFNNNNLVEEQIEGEISFINCVFEGDVFAYIHDKVSEYTFIANFENDVKFVSCTFKEEALFKYSEFERNADFSGSKFNKKSTFKYAEFHNKVSFTGTNFNQDGIFKYSEFKNGVSFNDAVFNRDLDIKYAKVRGDFDISNLSVSNDIDSKYTKINGKSFTKYLLDSRN